MAIEKKHNITIDDLREMHRECEDILWHIGLKIKEKEMTLNTGIALKDVFGRSEDATDYFLDVYNGHSGALEDLKAKYLDKLQKINMNGNFKKV